MITTVPNGPIRPPRYSGSRADRAVRLLMLPTLLQPARSGGPAASDQSTVPSIASGAAVGINVVSGVSDARTSDDDCSGDGCGDQ
jgi:hypothetical protein